MATPHAPKQLSSNLLTMRFMQRAAASATQSQSQPQFQPSQQSHTASRPQSHQQTSTTAAATDPHPREKRRRNDPPPDRPTRTPDYGRAEALANSLADPQPAPQANTPVPAASTDLTTPGLTEGWGETQWVLTSGSSSTFTNGDTRARGGIGADGDRGLGARRVVVMGVGYGEIDLGERAGRAEGRRVFGLKRAVEGSETGTLKQLQQQQRQRQNGGTARGSSQGGTVSDEDAEESEDDEDTEEKDAMRAEQDARLKTMKQSTNAAKNARKKQRRKEAKQVDLSRLSSISGGGGEIAGHRRKKDGENGGQSRDSRSGSRKRKKSGDGGDELDY